MLKSDLLSQINQSIQIERNVNKNISGRLKLDLNETDNELYTPLVPQIIQIRSYKIEPSMIISAKDETPYRRIMTWDVTTKTSLQYLLTQIDRLISHPMYQIPNLAKFSRYAVHDIIHNTSLTQQERFDQIMELFEVDNLDDLLKTVYNIKDNRIVHYHFDDHDSLSTCNDQNNSLYYNGIALLLNR